MDLESSASTTPQSYSATLTPFDPDLDLGSSRVMSTVASSPPETTGSAYDDKEEDEDDDDDKKAGKGGDGDDADYELPKDDIAVRSSFSIYLPRLLSSFQGEMLMPIELP